jgi:hypothetical protein
MNSTVDKAMDGIAFWGSRISAALSRQSAYKEPEKEG